MKIVKMLKLVNMMKLVKLVGLLKLVADDQDAEVREVSLGVDKTSEIGRTGETSGTIEISVR